MADSYRTIEGLMQSQKAQNLAAEQRAQTHEAMLRQLHDILADIVISKTSQGGSGGPPTPPPGLPSVTTDHRYDPDHPRVASYPTGSIWGPERSFCHHKASHQTIMTSRMTTKGVMNWTSPYHQTIRMEKMVVETEAEGGIAPKIPMTPTTTIPTVMEVEAPPSGWGRRPTLKPPKTKEAESTKVAVFPRATSIQELESGTEAGVCSRVRPTRSRFRVVPRGREESISEPR